MLDTSKCTSTDDLVNRMKSVGITDDYVLKLTKKKIKGKKQIQLVLDAILAKPDEVRVKDWVDERMIGVIAKADKPTIKKGLNAVLADIVVQFKLKKLLSLISDNLHGYFSHDLIEHVVNRIQIDCNPKEIAHLFENSDAFNTKLIASEVRTIREQTTHQLMSRIEIVAMEKVSFANKARFNDEYKRLADSEEKISNENEILVACLAEINECFESGSIPKRSFLQGEKNYLVELKNHTQATDLTKYLVKKIIQVMLKRVRDYAKGTIIPRYANGMLDALVKSSFKLDSYKDLFPQARSKPRRFIYLMGETNSGKTHEALRAYTGARNGVYLAPLRLLAAEIQEQMNDNGVPCDLITGEECQFIEGAQHVSCTIETLNYENEYEVAIIDEIQMISDSQRGGHWLNAVMGVNADVIYLCGSGEVESEIKDIIGYLGDSLEIQKFDRKTTLNVHKKRVSIRKPIKNSAYIAFSGRKVEKLHRDLTKMGIKASKIYGAMPNSVRRLEAEKFRNGETDVLISTDAIAMGLNLKIENVVFTESVKYNGYEMQQITPTLAKQIAGRAGRFGMYEEGNVYTTTEMRARDAEDLIRAINSPKCSLVANKSVEFNFSALKTIRDLTGEVRLARLLKMYENNVTFDFGISHRITDLHYRLARIVDELDSNLSFTEKCKVIKTPISQDEIGIASKAVRAIADARCDGRDISNSEMKLIFGRNQNLGTQKRINDVAGWFTNTFKEMRQHHGYIEQLKDDLVTRWTISEGLS